MSKSLRVYDGRLDFNEEAHVYTFNGTPVRGVTSTLKVINKPALIQWAANMASGWVKDNFKEGMSSKDVELLCREAARAHNKVRDTAAGIGTEVHAFVEASLKGEPLPKITTPEALASCNAFLDWRTKHEIKPIANEQILFSREHWYAGTCDIIAEIDGQITIADIKTSSGIYPEMFMQIAAYTIALEEMRPDFKIARWMIVRLDKKSGQLEVGEMARTQLYMDAFLACATLDKKMKLIEEFKNEHMVKTKAAGQLEGKRRATSRAPRQQSSRVPKRAAAR